MDKEKKRRPGRVKREKDKTSLKKKQKRTRYINIFLIQLRKRPMGVGGFGGRGWNVAYPR